MSGLIHAPQLIGQPQPALYLPFALHKALDPQITFTRASAGWAFDATPTLQEIAIATARFRHLLSDSTSLGLVIEAAETNGIRNNTMTGASAGTPGDLPNNWSMTLSGVTREMVDVGTTNGINTIDIKLSGTPSDEILIFLEVNTAIDALTTETWTASDYMALIAGDLTNISQINIRQAERTEAGAAIMVNNGSDFKGSLTSSLQRFDYSVTLSGGGTVAHILPIIVVGWDGSGDIDLTLRIGIPKEAQSALALSDIKTTNAAVTRAADVATNTSPVAAKTVFIAARTAPAGGTQVLLQRDDGDENERIRIERNSSDEIHFIVTDGGVDQADLNLGTVADDTDFGVAVRFAANDFAGSLDGAAVVTDTGGTIPTITTERFGVDSAGNYWNSTIDRYGNFSGAFSDDILRNLAA